MSKLDWIPKAAFTGNLNKDWKFRTGMRRERSDRSAGSKDYYEKLERIFKEDGNNSKGT